LVLIALWNVNNTPPGLYTAIIYSSNVEDKMTIIDQEIAKCVKEGRCVKECQITVDDVFEIVFTGQIRSGYLPKLAMTATGQMTADSKKP